MTARTSDKYIAYKLGYRVALLEGTGLYLLHKPHRRELGGLSALKGPGPGRKVPGKRNHMVAYSEEDAWEWVPAFSTDQQHADELRTHFFIVLEHIIPAHCISAKHIARYCINYLAAIPEV